MTGYDAQDDRLEMPPMVGLVRAADQELARGAPRSDVLDKRSAIQDLSQMARCQHKETLDQVQGVGVFFIPTSRHKPFFFDVPDKQSAICWAF
jgi:hypothetical protein